MKATLFLLRFVSNEFHRGIGTTGSGLPSWLGNGLGALFTPDFSGPKRGPGRGPRPPIYTAGDWLTQDLVHCRAGVDPDKKSLEQGHLIAHVIMQSPIWEVS